MVMLQAHFHRLWQSELAANVQLSGQQGSGYSTFPRINGIFYVGMKYSIEKDEPFVKVFLLQFFGEERKSFENIYTFQQFQLTFFTENDIIYTRLEKNVSSVSKQEPEQNEEERLWNQLVSFVKWMN